MTSQSIYPLSCHSERGVEPLLESAAALEDGRQEEVEQCPQLGQLVLQWSTGEEEAAGSHIVGVEHLGQFTVMVLHAVTFVHDHVLPTNLYMEEDSLN